MLAAEFVQGQILQRQTLKYALVRLRLAAVGQHIQTAQQGLALGRVGPQVQLLAGHPAGHVPGGVRGVDAEGGAEAGLLRLGAGQGHDDAALPAGLVVGIHRIAEEYFIKNVKAPAVAGPDAEDHKGLRRVPVLDHFDLLAGDLEVYQVLHLGEEQVLGAAHGIQGAGQLHPFLPGLEGRGLGLAGGNVQLLLSRNSGKEVIQLGNGALFHCSLPLSWTTEGSGSPVWKFISGGRVSMSAPA